MTFIELARRAEASLQNGAIKEAFQLGRRMDALAPQLSAGPFTQGFACLKSGQLDLAIQFLETAVAREPRPNCLFWLANASHLAGRFAQAADTYAAASLVGDRGRATLRRGFE